MRLKYNFVLSEVAGKTVAVAVGEDAAKFNGFIKMNATGAEIFRILKQEVTFDELILKLKSIYSDEDIELLYKAAESFLRELRTAGVLNDA